MSLNGSNYEVLATGLAQNYGLCLDRVQKHVFYIQGGHGGSISCFAYGGVPCPGGKNGVILTGLNYPYMCAVDTIWTPYGGPTTVYYTEPNFPGGVYAFDDNALNQRQVRGRARACLLRG